VVLVVVQFLVDPVDLVDQVDHLDLLGRACLGHLELPLDLGIR